MLGHAIATKEDRMRTFIGRYLLLLVGLLSASESYAGSLTWSGTFATNPIFEPQVLTSAVSITSLRIDITNFPHGPSSDACIVFHRTVNPQYPGVTAGYSEVVCWHAFRGGAAENWTIETDFSATPLFLPRDTYITCAASVAGATPAQAAAMQFACTISYDAYAGGPRYRTLRLPYNDQTVNPDGSLATTYYVSSTRMPLRVKAIGMFQAFGLGNPNPSSAQPCLRWLQQGGGLVAHECYPEQTYAPNANYSTPSALRPVDWTLPTSDLLNASCQNSSTSGDCALYAFVEVPTTIPRSAENVVRDYDNVPHPFLDNWCAQYVAKLAHPYYCLPGQPPCPDEVKIANCIALFPLASP